jgi:hypothetical protein
LSAAYAVETVRRDPERVRQLTLLSPTFETSSGAGGRLFGRLLRLPVLGTGLFNLLVSHASIQSFLRKAYGDMTRVDESLIGQNWATAHQPNARLAPAAFVAGQLDLPAARDGGPLGLPVLVIRGTAPGIGTQASEEELRAIATDLTIDPARRTVAARRGCRPGAGAAHLTEGWSGLTTGAAGRPLDVWSNARRAAILLPKGQVAQLVRAPR